MARKAFDAIGAGDGLQDMAAALVSAPARVRELAGIKKDQWHAWLKGVRAALATGFAWILKMDYGK